MAEERKERKPKTEWVAEHGRWQEVPAEGAQDQESRREALRRDKAALLAVGAVRLAHSVSKSAISQVLATEMVRAATRVGVMLRGVARTKSEQDALNKLRGAEESVDETVYWLEIMREANIGTDEEVVHLRDIALELTDIVTDDLRTALAAASAAKAARNDRGGSRGGFGDRGDRPSRPYGGDRGGDRGDRPPRPYGDREQRPYGDRGDRPSRPYGDRGADNRGGDRPPRPPYGDDRPNRPYRRRED